MYRVIQIYYDDKTFGNCYDHPCVEKYFNESLTDYFENSVICDYAERAREYDFFGVWSHKHKSKIQGRRFEFDILEKRLTKVDVIGFCRWMRNGRIFSGKREQKYKRMFNMIMEHLGMKYRFPHTPRFIVMQNHFIARGNIFYDYVDKVLRPAMELMNVIKDASEVISYRGPATYTFKPFLCEKLFSAYLEERKFKCEQW